MKICFLTKKEKPGVNEALIATESITKDIAFALGCKIETAEKLKKDYGLRSQLNMHQE